jgi:uncharacterized repeat protein (TIGR03803 family)
VQTAAGEAIDDNLEFGSIKMIPGKALLLGTNQASVKVSKQWIQLDGRNFLVESVPIAAVADGLSALPASAARQSSHGKLRNLLMALHPQRRATATEKSRRKISISRVTSPAGGLLMDFVTINGGLTNHVFTSDSTTYISGSGVTLFGTNNVFEGGAVIKFAPSGPWTFYSTGPTIEFESTNPVIWPVDEYRPVILTARDDNTVGATITGSTGSPSGYYGDPMLDISHVGSQTMSNFRISWAQQAVTVSYSSVNLDDGQFVNCFNGITGGEASAYFGNVLFANVLTNFDNFGAENIVAQNATFSDSDCFWGQSAAISFTFALTNCILANITNLDSYPSSATNIIGAYNCSYAAPILGVFYDLTYTNPFQSVGAGNYYLANGSPFRAAGTPNIDPDLLADLAQKTTYPPLVYDGTNISGLGTLGPQASRDTNTAAESVPDLGWHYPPLDYVFGGCDLTNNLTFTAGTAVGWFEDSGSLYEHYPNPPYGIGLGDSASLSFDGNATEPDAFVKFNTVQEGVNSTWDQSGFLGAMMFDGDDTNREPQFSANFTEFSQDSAGGNLLHDDWAYGAASFNNCEFYTANFSTYDMQYVDFTNCLLFRCDASFYSSGYQGSPLGEGYALSYVFENCTFYNGSLFSGRYSGSNPFNDAGLSSSFWLMENCAIDGTAFSWSDCLNGNLTNTFFNYNAYNTNNLGWTNFSSCFGTNEFVGTNDLLTTNYNWESSSFGSGDFYLPTNSLLINRGSTNAGALGLYWFTTQTNQTVESNSTVDIGYHYIATDADGNPLDYLDPPTPNYISYPDGPPTNFLEIVTNPVNLIVTQGNNATFSISAEGFPVPLSYQWFWNGLPLSDAGGVSGSQSPTLNLSAVNPDQAGSYYVTVTNSFGSATSASVALIVLLQTNAYDAPPLYIMPPNAYWNVSDISDPAQPVTIGELQAPFSEPSYPVNVEHIQPLNSPWHTNANLHFTESFGTTVSGGVGKGTVFRLDPAGPMQGNQPNELIACGNTIYGTTAGFNGSTFDGYGAIFSVDTNGSGFTTLFNFTPAQGWQPEAGLVMSGSTVYGTTTTGGKGFGTVFSFDLTNGVFRAYDFDGSTFGDGAYPYAKLVLFSNTLYGTTSSGGVNNKGTVFEINANIASGDQVLHSFAGGTEDGAGPTTVLLLSGGVLFGTTPSDGLHGKGTVFSVSTNASDNNITILHNFDGGGSDGDEPEAGLVISGGTLYGTTEFGGAYGEGTVFSVNGTNFTILHSFNDTNTNDGAEPTAGLTLSGQALYGTTSLGGTADVGTVFSMDLSNGDYTNLYSFQDGPDGESPDTTLLLSGNTLFGTTLGDSGLLDIPNDGTIFSINTNGDDFTILSTFSTFAVLHEFTGTNGDGANPCSQVAVSGSVFYGIPVTVYGTTSSGGTNGYGTVFKVNDDGTGFTNIYDFTGGTDGRNPQTGLLISGGTLYGATTNSIFKINTDGSDFACLTNVAGASQLLLSMSGETLYGTISNGGLYGYGRVFSINTDGSGFTNIYSFTGNANGQYPDSGLALYCHRSLQNQPLGVESKPATRGRIKTSHFEAGVS